MHVPVLKKEAIEYLDVKPNENFIDCTLGQMGHTLGILEKNGPGGKVLGIDWSQTAVQNAKSRIQDTEYKDRVIIICDNFANLKKIVEKINFAPVAGILLDLGMSSWHLEESKKGFSFQQDEPLDMRYNIEAQNLTAEMVVNERPKEEIERILREYGEERFAGRIAAEIIKSRKLKPIKTTFQLVEIIKRATPVWYQHKKIHFATRVFQALRIAVNDELNNLAKVLPQTSDILEPGARLVVISFHSLEDRIVKSFLKDNSQKGHFKILTNKPVVPAEEEQASNPRSRSAKMRCAEITRHAI